MNRSELKEIIQEEVRKFLLETGEPDQDYDHEIYDAIVDEIGYLGYEASHREFDKYQGIFIQVSGVGRFWFDDVSYHGDDVMFTIFPEDDSDMKFNGSVYKSDDGEWIANIDEEFKEYLDGLKTESGRGSKSQRRSDRDAREQEEGKRASEEYEQKKPKLYNEHLKGKSLVITTPYGKTYKVDEQGRITRGDMKDMKPSNEWLFIGLVRTNAVSQRVDIRFQDITPEMLKELSLTYKNGNPRYTAMDWDHGTYSSWGNTKAHGIKNMYIQ